MHIHKQIPRHLKRALRTSLALGARGVLASLSAADRLRARRANAAASAQQTAQPKTETVGDSNGPEDNRMNRIDLARFDDEEFDAVLTGEWGVGWRMNERAINRRTVLARSLSEFLGSVEPEKTH